MVSMDLVHYPLGVMRQHCAFRAATAMLLALPGVTAQDQAQPPLFGKGRALELTLQGAEELALQNNLGLKIEDLSREAALYAAKGSWGAFDWSVNAAAGWNDDEFHSTSVFGGSKTNTQTFGLDLVRPVEIGGTLTAHFDTANTKTDSTFSALPTFTNDVVSLSYVQRLLRGAWRQYGTAQQTMADMAWRRQIEHERADEGHRRG